MYKTIGEVNKKAPVIGDNCLIGAGAVIIGGVKIGSHVKVGAGAVVSTDIPDGCIRADISPVPVGAPAHHKCEDITQETFTRLFLRNLR